MARGSCERLNLAVDVDGVSDSVLPPAMKTSATLCLALLAAPGLQVLSLGAESQPMSSADRSERLSIANDRRRPAIARAVHRSDWRIRMGDDIRWAQPDWDDSGWERLGSMFDSPARRGIFWVRFRVRSPDPADRLPTGIYTSGPIAYELYWDGVLRVRNGVPGNSHEEEVPGRMDVVSTLPETMTGPGGHTVAMRISSYRCGVPGNEATFRFFMNDPVKVTTWVMRNGIAPTLAAGAMFILAIVCALLWFLAARRPPILFVGSMCLWAAAMQALIALRWFYNYPSDWWYPLMLAEDFAHGVFAWCFVAFVIAHFAVPHGRWILAAVVPWLACIHWVNARPPVMQNSWVIIAAYGAAIGPLLWAAWRRHPGAWPVIFGVLVSAGWILTNPWLYTWNQFLSRFSPVLLGVTAAIAMQIRVERREAQQTRLTATRLEIELLKKSLQPHFLMNTLTALMEVIEEDQTAAVNLIDDLAGEFRLLESMSAQKTVPLAREIELCRTHLRLMSVRKGRKCRFEVENDDDTAPVPPALFLTLIENGFSHQRVLGGPIVFRLLRSVVQGGAARYTFTSPGAVQNNSVGPPGGTGLRYVKARLEESTPGRWTFTHGAVVHGWETIVEIGLRRPELVRWSSNLADKKPNPR